MMLTMAHQQSQFQFPTPSTAGYNITTPQTQYSLYSTNSQGTSPNSGASSAIATPQGSSPTSPHTMHAAHSSRQLRPQKVPMYVPAVLRPTQPPRSKKGKEFTPPGSMSGSLESSNGFESEGLRRSNTADSMTSSKWGLGRVGSLREGAGVGPSREHWKPDSQSTLCDAPACTKPFSTFNRRHHCRRCGNIFCDAHSSYLVPLDTDASFSPDGQRSRACDHCFTEFVAWERKRAGARDIADNKGGETAKEVQCEGSGSKEEPRRRLGRMESIAASVPRDWNWSTF